MNEQQVKIMFFYKREPDQTDQIESMWATPVNGNYQIDNIPFYVSEYALGDIVSAKEEDSVLYIDGLVEESGNSTIQIIFFDRSIVESIRKKLNEMGCNSEGSERYYYISVNVPQEVDYFETIKPYLIKGENEELWSYKEACIASCQIEETY